MSITLPRRSTSFSLSPTLGLVIFALVACGLLDIGVTLWVIAGPPLGKTDGFFLELAELIAGLFIVSVAAILYPSTARVGLPYGFMVLAWHTGFQISFSDTTPTVLSALDVMVPLVLLVGLIGKWYSTAGNTVLTREFFGRFRFFGIFSLWGLALALARGTDPAALLMNLKAFTLYPFIALIMLWCIRTKRQLYSSVGFLLVLIFQRAVLGVLGRGASSPTSILSNGHVASRINGNFASVNQYAFYIMSGLLIAVALIVAGRSQRARIVLSGAVLVMGIALLLTLSRGAWLGTVAGLSVLALFLRLQRLAGLLGLIAIVFVGIQLSQPGSSSIVSTRLNATAKTDQSLGERQGYYALGAQVLLHYPFGAGWGAAFILGPSGLQADHDPNDWPWYHNDYLQLATQVGIPGLLAFAWIVVYVFRRAIHTSRRVRHRGEFAVIVGLVVALVGMLVQALTDQFFWRTDIAPHIWILVGLLLAATSLANSSLETPDTHGNGARSGARVEGVVDSARRHTPK